MATTREILQIKEPNGTLTQKANRIIGDIKSFTKEERLTRVTNLIREQEPPEQLNMTRYQNFKDAANLILRYETEADMKDKQDIIRENQRPTCQQNMQIRHN